MPFGTISRRRVVIAAAIATALTATACLTANSWWQHGDYHRNLTAARVTLWFTTFGLACVAPGLLRRMTRLTWIVLGAWAVYGTLWLVAMWPGIIMTDTHAQVGYIRSGTVYDWFTYLHSVLTMMVFDVVPHVVAFGPLQILGTAGLMAFASAVVLEVRRSVPAVVVMNLAAALAAPVIANTLLYSRDTPYALAHVALALYVARAVVVRRSISPAGVAGVAAATGLLSVYRGDGIALLVAVPLALLLLRPARAAVVRGALAFVVAAGFFHQLLPLAFEVFSRPHHYELSLKINPLGAVLQSNFYAEDKERVLRDLSRVIDVEAVRQMSEPSEIQPFWQNKWNQEASEADWAAFNRAADELLLENAWTAFANRVETFGASTGLAPGQFTVVPLDREVRFSFIGVDRGLKAEPLLPGLYDRAETLLSRTTGFTGAISTRSALFWNFLPALLLLLLTLPFWRRLPLEALVSALLLCRVPLVFIAAPAAQFKYYYAVYLGAFVVAGLLLGRLRADRLGRRIAVLRRRPVAA